VSNIHFGRFLILNATLYGKQPGFLDMNISFSPRSSGSLCPKYLVLKVLALSGFEAYYLKKEVRCYMFAFDTLKGVKLDGE